MLTEEKQHVVCVQGAYLRLVARLILKAPLLLLNVASLFSSLAPCKGHPGAACFRHST